MGALRSVVWLVLAGCSASATTTTPTPTPTGAQCVPSATSTGALRLVAMTPDVVSLHGGDVELTFEGDMPRDPIYVNGQPAVLDGTTLHVPPAPLGNAPLSIRVGDMPNPVASLDCAGQYMAAPDSVALASCETDPAACHPLPDWNETLAIPMHPELAHECARTGQIAVTNDGDWGMQIVPSLTGSPGFQTVFAQPTCPLPLDHDSCQIVMCFSSSTPAVHHAQLEVPSTAETATLDFTATVLPRTPGLAYALWRPFAFPSHELARDIAPLPGGGFAVWDDAPAQTFDVIAANGTTVMRSAGASVRALRAGAAGQGIYAIVGSATSQGATTSLVHFDDTGNEDPAFTAVPLTGDGYFARAGIEVTASGVLVIGDATVRSIGAAGDTTWALPALFTGTTALDSQGRLYVTTQAGLVRFTSAGQLDATFTFTGAVSALTLAGDAPLVAVGASVLQLDNTGAATTAVVAPHPVTALSVDTSGRIHVVTSDGVLTRYASGSPTVVGFDGTSRIACGANACAAVGLANGIDKYALGLAP